MSDEHDTTPPPPPPVELAPADYCDPVIEAYKKDVDRTLLRENLKLTPEERLRKADRVHASVAVLREAGKRLRTPPGRTDQT
jgi:hypothetical protein